MKLSSFFNLLLKTLVCSAIFSYLWIFFDSRGYGKDFLLISILLGIIIFFVFLRRNVEGEISITLRRGNFRIPRNGEVIYVNYISEEHLIYRIVRNTGGFDGSEYIVSVDDLDSVSGIQQGLSYSVEVDSENIYQLNPLNI